MPDQLEHCGLLESALAGPRNQSAFGEHSLARLAARYAFGISRNHPFLDGNKRTSLVVAESCLALNGCESSATENQLADWIAAHLASA